MITHSGGCHCGRVRFEVDAPAELLIDECNCSMCSRFAYQHLIVPAERFRLITGSDALTTYTFNTGTAKHYFCSTCGVAPIVTCAIGPPLCRRQRRGQVRTRDVTGGFRGRDAGEPAGAAQAQLDARGGRLVRERGLM